MLSLRSQATLAQIAALASILSCATQQAFAYTPNSPDVQALAQAGTSYIEQNFGRGPLDSELGGVCICALACYSQTGDANHPIVQRAIARIREDRRNGFTGGQHENYSLGIALTFLSTLDNQEYRDEVTALLDKVYENQQPGGGWGYPGYTTGDTSQSQFACLGIWMAHRMGIEVKQSCIERACNWWIRTQDPSGAFQYQGLDPGDYTRVKQTDISPSLTAAGVGSLYVCGELLGFISETEQTQLRQELPPVFRPVVDDRGAVAKLVAPRRWRQAVKDGDSWLSSHASVENIYKGARGHQQYYYMYAIERYAAFRDLALEKPEAEPAWYNAGVEHLREHQAADGSWTSHSEQSASIDTAFAVLFLLRSSQKVVERPASGWVDHPRDFELSDPPLIDQVIDQLEDVASKPGYLIPDKLSLSKNPRERQTQMIRLRRLLLNGSFRARLVAARTLGTVRDLENAPALIFALSDPDYRVIQAARDSLRQISRKPDGFGLEIDGKRPGAAQLQQAWSDWKQWLLAVHPDAEFIE